MKKLFFIVALVITGFSLPVTDNFPSTAGCYPGIDAFDDCTNWTIIQGSGNPFLIIAGGGSLQSIDGADHDIIVWNADTPTQDHYAQITTGANISAGFGYIGPVTRGSAGGNGYAALCDGHLYKFVLGSPTTLASFSPCANNDVIKLEATGGLPTTSLKVYINTVQSGSTYNDSSVPLTTGACGVYGYPTTGAVAVQFQCGNAGAGPGPTIPYWLFNFPIRGGLNDR